jgi:hypothetical protein
MSPNPWINHIKKVQNANPSLSWGEAMSKAKNTYQQQGGAGSPKSASRKSATRKSASRKSGSRKSRPCVKRSGKRFSAPRRAPPYIAANCQDQIKFGVSGSKSYRSLKRKTQWRWNDVERARKSFK